MKFLIKPRIKPMTTLVALAVSASFLGAFQAGAAASINTASFGSLEDAISALGTSTYLTIDPNYTIYSDAVFSFTVDGRTVSLVYETYGATETNGATGTGAQTISVIESGGGEPLAIIGGDTREVAEIELRSFLTDLFSTNPDTLISRVANSPSDPIAGNPASLQTTMSGATFSSGTDIGPSPLTGGARASGTLARSHIGVSLQSGRYRGPGFSAEITTLPLSYSIPFDDPRWALKLDAPLTFTTVNGQQTFSGSIGIGLRMPVFDNWTITPELRVGMGRNKALNVNAALINASVSSNYRKSLRNGYQLVFGNSLTYSKSITVGGVNYGIDNVINKNGIEFSGPMQAQLFGLPTNWQFSVVHSKIYGTPTYIDEWVDVSASVGSVASKNGVTWDAVRFGITYTRANRGVDGINFNFGYEF